jgi:hypothetical protein
MLDHNNQMKRWDEISKKNIFEVPEGYFDKLALNIQAKTEKISPQKSISSWSFTFRYALPVALLIVGIIIVLRPRAVQDTEQILASIPSEHLIAYLSESDMSEHELLEAINFDEKDADSLNVRMHNQYLPNELNEDEFKRVLENEL